MNGLRLRRYIIMGGIGVFALLLVLAAYNNSKHNTAVKSGTVTRVANAASVRDEAPEAVTKLMSNTIGDTAGGPTQTSEGGVWKWHEWGLEITYPAGWQGILTDAPFVFVIAGPTDESGQGPYIAVQAGAYDTSLTFREFMEQLTAADSVALTDITFGGIEGVGFETASGANNSRFVAIPYPEGQVMLVGQVASSEEWETWSPVMDEIIASAIITPLDLDEAALNEQMQANLETTGLMTVGDPEAPLWIAEFMDFSCPHCYDYSAVMDRLVQDYVVTGKAQFTLGVLDFVGGEASTLAAQYQVCGARLGVGWTIHHLIFAEYAEDQAGRAAYTEENLAAMLLDAELDIDYEAFNACLGDETTAAIIADHLAWAEEVGVSSTPNVLLGTSRDDVAFMKIGDQELQGGYPLYYVYPILDTKLTEAETSVVPSAGSDEGFSG